MADFQGFVFKDPNKKETREEALSQSSDTIQLNTEPENEHDVHGRLQAFRESRTPFNSRSEIQEKRRLQALELQKRQRNDIVASLRQLDILENNEEEQEHNPLKRGRGDSDEEMEDAFKLSKPNPTAPKKKNQQKNIYTDQIMYAEYLEAIPGDFVDEWMSVICPKGKRCLIMSGEGKTVARSRGGKIINRFQSVLPNGSRYHPGPDYSILDCIYDREHWTFYVLDIMCWRGYSVTDCDTSFRNFWLHTKFESNELDAPNSENRYYKFVPLKCIPTSEVPAIVQNPEAYLNTSQQLTYDIDGLLFYHRQAHYVGGSTPLVCWVPRDNISQLLSQQ